jgi:integrase/recombinase XerD
MPRVSRKEIEPGFSWEKLIKDFVLLQRAKQRRERTIQDYEYHITLFFNRTQIQDGDSSFENLQQAVIAYFAVKLAPATFNTRRKKLKTFFDWLVKEGKIPENPLKDIKKVKEDENPRDVHEEIVIKLLQQPNRKTFVGLRDYAMMLLEMDTGIRPSEATGLLLDDLNLSGREITVPADISKTGISRTVPIMPITAQAISKLVEVRHQQWSKKTPVFCSEDGKRLQTRGWCHRYEKYSKEIGQKVTPYNLRHTFAVMFLRGGGDAFALQKMLGHKDMSMTKRYVNYVTGDVKDQHDKASPINNLFQTRAIKRKIQ